MWPQAVRREVAAADALQTEMALGKARAEAVAAAANKEAAAAKKAALAAQEEAAAARESLERARAEVEAAKAGTRAARREVAVAERAAEAAAAAADQAVEGAPGHRAFLCFGHRPSLAWGAFRSGPTDRRVDPSSRACHLSQIAIAIAPWPVRPPLLLPLLPRAGWHPRRVPTRR